MGEYWKPVNLTRGEFIHPHHVGCGLKIMEWNHPGSGVRLVMKDHWKPTDDVRALSDYGGEMQLSGVPGSQDSPHYEDIEAQFVEVGLTVRKLGVISVESFAAQLLRLQHMAETDVLSHNERAALMAVLLSHTQLLASLKLALPWIAKVAADHDDDGDLGISSRAMHVHGLIAESIARAEGA